MTDLPIIFCIDDDRQVLRAVLRDLKRYYDASYRVMGTTGVAEGLDTLKEIRNKGEEVALLIADQRMPDMDGVNFLKQASAIYPDAKKTLLTAYSDKDSAIRAINTIHLDYYFMKPWDPPEEHFFPVTDGLLGDWQGNYYPDFKGIKVVGFQYCRRSHGIKEFLAGNLVPYRWLDFQEDSEGTQLLAINGLTEKDLPVVFMEDGSYSINPELAEIAEHIGLNVHRDLQQIYDVVVIGAGPAGLAAAVYGASEGLKTLIVERNAPGGQAGTSSKIENYLGFPAGLSGADLTRRALAQAERFGAEFLSLHSVKVIEEIDRYKRIIMDNGTTIITQAIVITTGIEYRKLEIEGIEKFNGAGIYYGAATTEARSCENKEVFIVGGGNSAGQAAMYLSRFARNVHILIRKEELNRTMSDYLIQLIRETPNVSVCPNSRIKSARGSGRLELLEIESTKDDAVEFRVADALYIFIGARPYTEWLGQGILKNADGFVETGRSLEKYQEFGKLWKLRRNPYPLETSMPGVFAAGDVRASAMNRVASAVGEGSMSISFVHRYLAER